MVSFGGATSGSLHVELLLWRAVDVLKHAMVGFRELVLSSVNVRWRRKETDNRLKEVLSFSSRSSFVTVMEASHFRDLDHPSKYRRLDRSRFRRIFIQCQMRARMQIVLKIRFQNPTERTFVEHHNVIEAFAAYGADEALGVWILPRRSGSRQHFLNCHPSNSLTE